MLISLVEEGVPTLRAWYHAVGWRYRLNEKEKGS